jgi:simple sugar transport system ATP-binding protein
VVLRVDNLMVDDARDLPALRGVSFKVREGEIYGIAGIEGNGQSELVEAITGLRAVRAGDILMGGHSSLDLSPAEILAAGLGHVPEDRLRRGLIGPFTVAENLILGYHQQDAFRNLGILREPQIVAHAKELVALYDIRTPSPLTPCSSLSGGNQQKTVLARVLSSQPKALVVAQPTRGLDVGATEYVHNQLLGMRDKGVAVLLISADLDEVRSLSDRIGVLYQGEIVAEKPAREFTEQELGLFMSGEKEAEAVAEAGETMF